MFPTYAFIFCLPRQAVEQMTPLYFLKEIAGGISVNALCSLSYGNKIVLKGKIARKL